MKRLDAIVAEDLLSRMNPSVQSNRLGIATEKCPYGYKQAERTIIKGLELLAKQGKKNEISSTK